MGAAEEVVVVGGGRGGRGGGEGAAHTSIGRSQIRSSPITPHSDTSWETLELLVQKNAARFLPCMLDAEAFPTNEDRHYRIRIEVPAGTRCCTAKASSHSHCMCCM